MGIRRSIMGFDQEEVLKLKKTITKEIRGVEKQVEIKLDLQDLLILKQIADFPNRKAITKVMIQVEIFFWVSYKQLIEELPILDIGKQALSDRLDKMSKLGLLKRTFQTIGGNSNMTFFKMGDAYEGLRYKKDEKQSEECKEDGYRSQTRDGIVSEYDTCRSQLRDINISVNKESVLELVDKENEDKSSFEKEYDFPSVAAEPMSEYGIKDWKKDFDEYKRLVEEAKEKLLSDEAFKQKMLKYYPNMDYELSIDKSITTYWGTEEGWNNKRAKRSKQINMLSTLKKNLDKSIVYKPKQNQAQAYKKETQEEYNMKLLRLPYEDKENGTLIDGTFVKGGYRYYHSQLNNKAVSCAMDAPERSDDRYEWDYRKNEWYLPYQLRTAADEIW